MSNKISPDGIKCNSFIRGRYFYDEKAKARAAKISCYDSGSCRRSYLHHLYVSRVAADNTVAVYDSSRIMAAVFLLKERYIL